MLTVLASVAAMARTKAPAVKAAAKAAAKAATHTSPRSTRRPKGTNADTSEHEHDEDAVKGKKKPATNKEKDKDKTKEKEKTKTKEKEKTKTKDKEKSKTTEAKAKAAAKRKVIVPSGHDVPKVQRNTNIFDKSTWTEFDDNASELVEADRAKRQRKHEAEVSRAADARDMTFTPPSADAAIVKSLLGTSGTSNAVTQPFVSESDPPELGAESGAADAPKVTLPAPAQVGIPATSPCIRSDGLQRRLMETELESVFDEHVSIEAHTGLDGSNTGDIKSKSDGGAVGNSTAAERHGSQADGDVSAASITAPLLSETAVPTPEEHRQSLFQQEREANMKSLEGIFNWPTVGLSLVAEECLKSSCSTDNGQFDHQPVFKHLVNVMKSCTISTSFSGIDTPATALAMLFLGANAGLKQSPTSQELKQFASHNLFAVEWCSASQHELLRHPFGPHCLFGDMASIFAESLASKVPALLSSRRLIEVALRIISSNESKTNIRSTCHCLRHNTECSAS